MPASRRKPCLDLSVADLFCGAGGISEGFAAAGFEIVYGVDNDADAVETFHANHPGAEHDQADLAAMDDKTLRRKVREVDVVVGGPCCQGFSTGGRHRKADWTERNGLWRSMVRAVDLGRPRAFVLENVPGLQMAQDGTLSGAIITAFAELGYQVQSRVLLAADYGVPQLRRRVLVIGVRGRAKFEWPEAPYLGGWRRDTLDLWEIRRREQGKHRHLTIEDAIDDLPAIPEGTVGEVALYTTHTDISPYAKHMRIGSKKVLDHEGKLLNDEHLELIAHVPQGGTWRDIPGHLLPDRFRGGMRRTDSTNLLGRLDPRRPAYTITTQFDNVTCGCFTHPTANRALTIREAARIQSFPDRYEFRGGGAASKQRQVGNAVPPLLAQYLACELAAGMGAEPRRPPVILSRFEVENQSPETFERIRTRRLSKKRPELLSETAVRGMWLSVATALQGLELSFLTNAKPVTDLGCKADIVFEQARVAVFVDGCFMHGCPEHSRSTKSNTKWWASKIDANRARDREETMALRAHGFEVIRLWEHEDPAVGAATIAALVSSRTGAGEQERPRMSA